MVEPIDLNQAQQVFIEESIDLLQQLEDFLLKFENDGLTAEDIHAMFRAAHTIKGSAGLFGFDHIVKFAHLVENLLDRIRSQTLSFTPALISLLLDCTDYLHTLIDQIAYQQDPANIHHLLDIFTDPEHTDLSNVSQEENILEAKGQTLSARLTQVLNPEEAKTIASVPATIPVTVTAPDSQEVCDASPISLDELHHPSTNIYWHLSLRFGVNIFRNGMDPASFLRYLETFGKIINMTTVLDRLPKSSERFDPESCYLGFELDFETDQDKTAIDGAFDFVREDCEIKILPPHSQVTEYIQLIQELETTEQAGYDLKIGEILVKSGVLTQHELELGLAHQRDQLNTHITETPDMLPLDNMKIGEILVKEKIVQQEIIDAALEKQKTHREFNNNATGIVSNNTTRATESRLIRVQADKLDQLINLVGELVIAGASASLIAYRSANVKMIEATSGISRLVEEIRDRALQLRMVQIGETFHRFHRVVRDVSHELQKEIELDISGGETELDKSVIEKIGDPLMHLVRNAMDHGIEPVDVRLKRGKPQKGKLALNAYHDSGNIVIEVIDDGGGLNREKILKKARAQNIIKTNEELSDHDILHLIFEPGFSTAEKVTNLSGRGVGMDVVRSNIEKLRGSVELESKEGIGTTVRIRLPLTLAIIDGFLVSVGDTVIVIPLDLVLECLELKEAYRHLEQGEYINLRGEVLPYLRLRDVFHVEGDAPRRENIVVVHYSGQKIGLVVDELMGEYQTVIKPLGKLFKHLRGISGSTILGTGEVALILDVQALVQRCVNATVHYRMNNNNNDLFSSERSSSSY